MTTIFEANKVQEMLAAWSDRKIQSFIQLMPNGSFLNLHNSKVDRCDGIVMLATGDICPVWKSSTCTLNPLIHNGDEVKLSTCATGGTIIGRAISLAATVEKYNSDLYKQIIDHNFQSFGRYAIVAYHSFNREW